MRISAKGRYALKMLVDLAENNSGEYISLSDISERQNISKKFLEQIVPMLVKTGMIRANRGNRGGYKLKKPAEICFVGDVLRATEGELLSVDEANYESDRKIAFVLEGLRDTLNKYADSISLQDIIEHQDEFYNYSI
ncbi:MAG: Rrf2 family transcriptional regulator [Ruminococcus flavefaciens]|nr:Rrf2 family transcriptional regulator [Ruminococcus flavefaciens]MCM1230830.1 Rrf2 family transcriptional regulator [Ruminococcus flavefaciens]